MWLSVLLISVILLLGGLVFRILANIWLYDKLPILTVNSNLNLDDSGHITIKITNDGGGLAVLRKFEIITPCEVFANFNDLLLKAVANKKITLKYAKNYNQPTFITSRATLTLLRISKHDNPNLTSDEWLQITLAIQEAHVILQYNSVFGRLVEFLIASDSAYYRRTFHLIN